MDSDCPAGDQPKEIDPITISDILKAALAHEGINCESATFLRWQSADDTILACPITTLPSLFREFRDGSFQLIITKATISRLGKVSFDVPQINVEAAYANGQWSELRIYNDYETTDHEVETSQTLEARLRRLEDILKAALEWLVLIVKLALGIRDMYS